MRLERRTLTPQIEAFMSESLGEGLEKIRADLINGKSDLFEVTGDHSTGFFVLRRDAEELVIVAAQGKNLVCVLEAILNHFGGQFKTARIHSSRPGMGRLIKSLGFEPVETIYRVNLHG